MTTLDLICAPSYFIGMLGSISFVCFAIGAFFFTKQADVFGRHRVTVIAGAITPICLTVMYFGAEKYGIYLCYGTMAIMALAYNPRSSTAYLYGAEILPPRKRLMFGTSLFMLDGCFGMFASFYFYTWKDQDFFFVIVFTVFSTALIVMAVLFPETPSFCLTIGDVTGF